jgi:hypothetical protein
MLEFGRHASSGGSRPGSGGKCRSDSSPRRSRTRDTARRSTTGGRRSYEQFFRVELSRL